jgi:hypothetical protein
MKTPLVRFVQLAETIAPTLEKVSLNLFYINYTTFFFKSQDFIFLKFIQQTQL